ncbi:NAC domain-containing protein 86 isoform X2 [Tripterygium wilfordii]|uniref:NAC domain-containing protein 86 isoform X2 n=1 Tax=Tripterygium wilfordii TaxID=458696 RepID=A0A7J7C829_TRIWF|nr:NAC domain-containing protein 86 isoform X2 [Tripterygium wilfordii]
MAPVGLPPGFRFHPTDEELVNYYLKRKINGQEIELDIIPEIDLYKCEPWELAEKSFFPSRDPEWYFFGPRDRKYPNGFRTNRATRAGYWKSTGKDRKVSSQNRAIGMKKTLVYYRGRAPQGIRTDWVMHEYRLDDKECEDTSGIQDSYALCRVFKKNGICSETEEQSGQCSSALMASSLIESSPIIPNDYYETMSPDVPVASSSCMEEEDKDDSWMQFITDDAWCSSHDTAMGGEEVSPVTFTN